MNRKRTYITIAVSLVVFSCEQTTDPFELKTTTLKTGYYIIESALDNTSLYVGVDNKLYSTPYTYYWFFSLTSEGYYLILPDNGNPDFVSVLPNENEIIVASWSGLKDQQWDVFTLTDGSVVIQNRLNSKVFTVESNSFLVCKEKNNSVSQKFRLIEKN